MKDRWVLVALAATVIGLALGAWGVWTRLPAEYAGFNRVAETAYGAFKVFTFGKTYQGSADWAHDWRLQAARWLGTLAWGTAAIKLALIGFRRTLRRVLARWRRGHVVVIGETPFARAFARLWERTHRRATIHLTDPEAADAPGLPVERTADLKDEFMRASLGGAGRIVVAEAEDSQTAQTTLALGKQYPRAEIFALLKEPWLAERLTDAPSTPGEPAVRRPTVISAASAAARAVLSRHPTYLQRGAGQDTHVLIVGLTPLAEALATDIMANGLVRQGEVCRITLVGTGTKAFRSAFEARHAGLFDEAPAVDMAFIEARPTGLAGEALAQVATRLTAHPACAAYVALSAEDDALVAAYALRDLAARTGLLSGPIFVNAEQGSGLAPALPGAVHEARRLVPFGDWDAIVAGSGLLDAEPDRLAIRFHESYRESHSGGGEADVPWDALQERYRAGNRRAVLHIPAKLHAAGFDITPCLVEGAGRNDPPALAPGQRLYRNLAELHALTTLEHDRWSMDRRLEGWRYGPIRDEVRRLHPDLVPFEALSPDIQAYDLRFVQWLSEKWLPERSDGLRRHPDAPLPEVTPDILEWAERLEQHGHSLERFDA